MPLSSSRTLSADETRKLALALQELHARGLPLPESYAQKLNPHWKIAPNGYFSKLNGAFYDPSDNQKAFIESLSRFVAFFGGRGSGKSAAASQKAMRKIRAGESGTVLSPNFEHFKTSTWPEFREWIDWNMVIPTQRHRRNPAWEPQKPFVLVFMNNVRVICKGLQNPDSARGPNLNWLWFDEAGIEETGTAWRIAIASIRVGKDPQAWISTTPKGKENWMYKFFVERQLPEEVLAELSADDLDKFIDFYVGSIEENKNHLDPNFYLSTVAAYPKGWMRARELDGLFVDEGGVLGDASWFTGKIFPVCLFTPKKTVRYWDLAASEKKIAGAKKRNDPDETCGTKLSWDGKKDFCIEDQVAGKWIYQDILNHVEATFLLDGPTVTQYFEQEPGAGGINQVEAIKSYFRDRVKSGKIPWMPNIQIHDSRKFGDKVMRANIWFGEASQGQYTLVNGNWNGLLLSQLGSFPLAAHDDRIDSVSGARLAIAPVKSWRKLEFMCV